MSTLSHHDIIKLSEADLVSALKQMPTEQLELHANNIMVDLGGDDYGALMKHVMQVLETQSDPAKRFSQIQNTLRDSLPNKAQMSDIYQRLATIVMLIITRRYQAILKTKS